MIFDRKIWVNWRLIDAKNGKKTKVPYQTNGKKASTTDPTTWSTYNEAKAVSDSIGIVFEPSVGIIGVDFDHCVENGKIKMNEIEKFIELCNTYTEFSPSKTGLHLLFQCSEPLQLERNKQHLTQDIAMEIYNNGRYFTYTGDIYKKEREIRMIGANEFVDLLKTMGYPWKKEVEAPVARSVAFDDGELKRIMFRSRNGKEVEALWNGDTTKYNNDMSSADFALCLHLAFWTGRDKERMKRLWLESPLGQREKTQRRGDYQERTLNNAIASTNEVFTPKDMVVEVSGEYIMGTGKHPEPLMILENICRVIDGDEVLSGKFRLNDFSHMSETVWDRNEWVNLYDGCIYEVQRYISTKYEPFRKVTKTMVTDAILSVAYRNKVNPPKEYFTGLVWDKIPRLNSWLHKVYGVADDELHQAMGSNWMKGLVKRVMQPGCIFDEVLALESKQGWRKSTSIRELGTPWHVETTNSMDEKDFYMIVAQNIIVEFSEGDIFDRTSMKKIKSEITKTEDQFRPPYERGMMTFKRSCVFAVTTNKLELKDDTGNRRWLPVSLEKIADIDWIKENRDQLFAEAYYRAIVLGETTHEYPKDALEALQESRNEMSDHDEAVLYWYAGLSDEKKEEGITITEAAQEAYGTGTKVDKLAEINVGAILRRTLRLENKCVRVKGAVVRRWKPTEKTKDIINSIIKENNENIF